MTDRRTLLKGLAAGAAAAALPRAAAGGPAPEVPACGLSPGTFPNLVVWSHEGRKALFHDDLVAGRTVLVSFMSVAGEAASPVTANLARVQALLGDRLGRDLFMYSITVDPEHDTPRVLERFAAAHGAGPGWLFLTGEPATIETLRGRLFDHGPGHRHGAPVEDCSLGLARYGNAAAGLWGSVPLLADPRWIAERLTWVQPRRSAAGAPRRRGPAALAGAALALVALALGGAAPASAQHPRPQPLLSPSTQTTVGDTTTVVTGESIFPPSAPFLDPPGTNFLPTIATNNFDSTGAEMPNTLPSTPSVPYNLHDGEPVVSEINPTSPTDDLRRLLTVIPRRAGQQEWGAYDEGAVRKAIQTGIDILEGNPVPNRAYSGLPLLHYTGPEKVAAVVPILDRNGTVVGGNVDVHQVWYDGRIESDVGLLDPSAVLDVPWTITYTVDVLDRGEDDFSPFVMYFDAPVPGQPAKAHVGMDQSFFPMQDGTRTVFKIKMAPAKYFSLVYTWGWRLHPSRAQVIDTAGKVVNGKTLVEWETSVFGPAPRSSEQAKLAAIAKIGDLSPAKRMWKALREARAALDRGDRPRVAALAEEARQAFDDWRDRTRLPRGVEVDPASDLTLLYVNNTIYGQLADGGLTNFPQWQRRGTTLKVTLYNGDHFDHGYQNVDFGGARGWENQFKSSVKLGGSGCWFTFGRAYWWMNLAEPAIVPAASGGRPGLHKVHITFNYEPSRRLRFYQFDPLHHDVAVYSIH